MPKEMSARDLRRVASKGGTETCVKKIQYERN